MKRLFATALCLGFYLIHCAAEIAGPWHGIADLGMQKLPLVFNISETDGNYAATMDSPLQGAKGIPAEISVANDTIRISIPMIGAKYSGMLSNGKINGTFEQHGMKFGIMLEPGEYIAQRPQTPQPPFPYDTRDVTFTNPENGHVLHGTVTLPILYDLPGKKLFNAAVMVTGSGTQDRDETIAGHKPFAVIAHQLALNGIASLRYDDYGYGDSIADMSQVTIATNASDAKAALDYLRNNFDRLNKAGILGHSEGGTIAMHLGATGDTDFVVSLAGAAVRGDSILMRQNQLILGPQLGENLTKNYLAGLQRTLEHLESNPDDKVWPEIETALADLMLPQQLVGNLKAIVSDRSPWLDYFLTYDPSDDIKKINVPVFAANGALDMQVDSHQNLEAIKALLPINAATVIKEYPRLNHLMQEAKTGLPSEYGEIEQTISPLLLQDLAAWILGLK